jgi:hypothetical protein
MVSKRLNGVQTVRTQSELPEIIVYVLQYLQMVGAVQPELYYQPEHREYLNIPNSLKTFKALNCKGPCLNTYTLLVWKFCKLWPMTTNVWTSSTSLRADSIKALNHGMSEPPEYLNDLNRLEALSDEWTFSGQLGNLNSLSRLNALNYSVRPLSEQSEYLHDWSEQSESMNHNWTLSETNGISECPEQSESSKLFRLYVCFGQSSPKMWPFATKTHPALTGPSFKSIFPKKPRVNRKSKR